MTREEATAILQRLTAAWPSPVMTTPTARLYLYRLMVWRYEWALEAVEKLEASSKRLPTIADLVESYNAVKRHREVAIPPETRSHLTDEQREAGIESVNRARAALARARRPPTFGPDETRAAS